MQQKPPMSLSLFVDLAALVVLFAALYGLADAHVERDTFRLFYLLSLLMGLQAILALSLLLTR